MDYLSYHLCVSCGSYNASVQNVIYAYLAKYIWHNLCRVSVKFPSLPASRKNLTLNIEKISNPGHGLSFIIVIILRGGLCDAARPKKGEN